MIARIMIAFGTNMYYVCTYNVVIFTPVFHCTKKTNPYCIKILRRMQQGILGNFQDGGSPIFGTFLPTAVGRWRIKKPQPPDCGFTEREQPQNTPNGISRGNL